MTSDLAHWNERDIHYSTKSGYHYIVGPIPYVEIIQLISFQLPCLSQIILQVIS
jgi:hypothetical protein